MSDYEDFLSRKVARAREYDPFGGLMTVPSRAVSLGRKGLGCELNAGYAADGVAYCEAEEAKAATPTLFDLVEVAS